MFTSAVLQSVGAGTKEYTIVYSILFYFIFIHPLVSPSKSIRRLKIAVDETSALFNEHRDVLITEEIKLTELRADMLTLIREDLEVSRRISITSVHSLMIFASEKKNTWKKAHQYHRDIGELRARMEIMLLKDAEENERRLVERQKVSRQGIFTRARQSFYTIM
ncbi:uncharacterized protein EV420DRAFT_992925 [Desarmillaria tabescens]|uniref:Uncharacterized protein n=1 Tax=Armillaria tabescens TaxID=1929756 RepID=A0AA39MSW7_ARMTA|nr:uncharacterized protein EV420DRAFT_992925 [Desarmillaria tabescens]KAK0444590.1 hypothetical protein EV420DRAFT_992925 [Desarmillaria tabescens]